MLNESIDQLLFEGKPLLLEAKNVAHVLENHSLTHAAIILGQIGYSRVPVLDNDNHFVGTIALSNIMKPMFDMDDIDARHIDHLKVGDVMDKENIVTYLPLNHEEILHKLVNANFLPVLDKENHFIGIVTRQTILKSVNALAHEIDKYYELNEKR